VSGKVIRVREEAYARLMEVSKAYGLTLPQAANLLILGSVGPRGNGKKTEEAVPYKGPGIPQTERLKCPQCSEDLGLISSGPGLYMLHCPKCSKATQCEGRT
jgi:hypothetical protein